MKDKNKLQDLIWRCRTGSFEQQANAIVELEEMGESAAIPVLVELLDSPDVAIRASAAEALGELADLGNHVVGSALLRLLNDADLLVRANTAEALGLLEYSGSIYDLISTLESDDEPLVRLCAAEALGHLGTPVALPALIGALSDSDPGVRSYAADSIGVLGSKAELLLLRQTLRHEKSPFVQAFILSALYRLGDDSAFVSLVNLLEHADNYLTTTIENLIKQLASPHNAATLQEMIMRATQLSPIQSPNVPSLLESLSAMARHPYMAPKPIPMQPMLP